MNVINFLRNLDTQQLLYGTAGLSITTALIHGLVTSEHFEEWWGYGLFFLSTALLQGFYGLLLIFQPWQPDPIRETAGFSVRGLYLAGIWGNGFVIALYIVTRTVGIPFFGPEAGEVEAVTLLSLISKLSEVALVVCLVVLLKRSENTKIDIVSRR